MTVQNLLVELFVEALPPKALNLPKAADHSVLHKLMPVQSHFESRERLGFPMAPREWVAQMEKKAA